MAGFVGIRTFLSGAVQWRFGSGATGPTLALGKLEAVAIHLEDMDVMREAIEKRAGQPLGDEDGRPLVEWQIARDDRRAALISLTEDLEQQFCAGWRPVSYTHLDVYKRQLVVDVPKAAPTIFPPNEFWCR